MAIHALKCPPPFSRLCFKIKQLMINNFSFDVQVAASRVKARQASTGLAALQGASKNGMLIMLTHTAIKIASGTFIEKVLPFDKPVQV